MKNKSNFLTLIIMIAVVATAWGQNAQKKGWDGKVKGPDAQNGSCPEGTTMLKGRCIANELLKAKWLNLETGQILYFEYSQDTPIDNPEICKALGVETCVIKKGIYPVERNDEGGKISLRIEPIKWINRPPMAKMAFLGTNPKGKDCQGWGNTCWYITQNGPNDAKVPFTITPTIDQETLKGIEVQFKGSGSPKNQGF